MTPAQIPEAVRRSRLEQGLSATVTGPLLAELAAEVLEKSEERAA
jgi:hypothetical protein